MQKIVALIIQKIDNLSELANIESVAPYKTVSSTVTREKNTSSRAQIIATTDDYMDVTNLTISSGRLLSKIDLENNSKVCLLGNDIATSLFNLSNPVGQSIRIDGDNYTVIGVLTACRNFNGE